MNGAETCLCPWKTLVLLVSPNHEEKWKPELCDL